MLSQVYLERNIGIIVLFVYKRDWQRVYFIFEDSNQIFHDNVYNIIQNFHSLNVELN